jgi:hypothetical protein
MGEITTIEWTDHTFNPWDRLPKSLTRLRPLLRRGTDGHSPQVRRVGAKR